jgi:hypothetical protein
MSGAEFAQIITSIATLIAVIRTGAKVEEVHKATNSLTDRLVETTRTEAHAAGLKEGQSHDVAG